MNRDLQTRLFANVILDPKPSSLAFRQRQRTISGFLWTAATLAGATGLLLLLIIKIKPLI